MQLISFPLGIRENSIRSSCFRTELDLDLNVLKNESEKYIKSLLLTSSDKSSERSLQFHFYQKMITQLILRQKNGLYSGDISPLATVLHLVCKE